MFKNTYTYFYDNEIRTLTSLTVYDVGFQQCEPGHKWGPGVRDYYLMHYVVSGRGEYTVHGTTYKLSAGDIFLAYPDTMIFYCADSIEPWEYCWIGFNGSDALQLLDHTDFSPDVNVIHTDFGDGVYERLLRIGEARDGGICGAVRMSAGLLELLAYLIEKSSRADSARVRSGSAIMRTACGFISNNYSSPISVGDIAEASGVSRSWLYRVFQEYIGASPSQYLAQFRITQACELLKLKQFTVNEVSSSVGFDDAQYFSRVFKKVMGVPPGKYMAKQ